MRTPSDAPDPFALGRKVEAPKPTAAPVPIGNGCVRNPDGTLATNAPPPAPVWVYTAPAATPGAVDGSDLGHFAGSIVWIPTPRDDAETND